MLIKFRGKSGSLFCSNAELISLSSWFTEYINGLSLLYTSAIERLISLGFYYRELNRFATESHDVSWIQSFVDVSSPNADITMKSKVRKRACIPEGKMPMVFLRFYWFICQLFCRLSKIRCQIHCLSWRHKPTG